MKSAFEFLQFALSLLLTACALAMLAASLFFWDGLLGLLFACLMSAGCVNLSVMAYKEWRG